MADAVPFPRDPDLEALRPGPRPVPPEPEWSEPRDLPPLYPAVPNLPDAMVPSALRPWLADIADRTQIPLEFVAVPGIVAVGAVIGRTVGIRPKRCDDWTVPGNLWGGIIGPPGVMKTPALSAATAPLARLAAAARKAHAAALADEMASQAADAARRDAIRDSMKKAAKAGRKDDLKAAQEQLSGLAAPAPAHERRYTTSDATIEKIGELNNQNPRGLLLIRDELTGFFRGLDREDRAQDRAFWLEGWNGTGGFTTDRIGRGTVHVEALCLSLLGGIQPGRMQPYILGAIAQSEEADGLLPRVQALVWPDNFGAWRYVDRWPNAEARKRANAVFDALDGLDPVAAGATPGDEEELEIPFLRFAPAAQDVFIHWFSDLEARLRSPEAAATPAFTQHLAKYRSFMPKLALIFDLIDRVAGFHPGGGVTEAAARQAAAWCEYLEAHARKLYAPELAREISAAHLLLDRIRRGDVSDGMSVRDVIRCEWSGLSTPGAVHSATKELCSHGWIFVQETFTGGRPSPVFRIHPGIRRGASA